MSKIIVKPRRQSIESSRGSTLAPHKGDFRATSKSPQGSIFTDCFMGAGRSRVALVVSSLPHVHGLLAWRGAVSLPRIAPTLACAARMPRGTRALMTELVAAPVAAPVPMKVNLLWLDEAELQALLKEWKQPKFRAKQIQDWIFEKGVTDFEQMSNLPAALRALLAEHATVGSMDVAQELVSRDGTRKRLWKLHDDRLIESVLMPYRDNRRTACISSQVWPGVGGLLGIWSRRAVGDRECQRGGYGSKGRGFAPGVASGAHCGWPVPSRVRNAAVGGLCDGLHILRDRPDGLHSPAQRR